MEGPWVSVDQPPPPTSLLTKAWLELLRRMSSQKSVETKTTKRGVAEPWLSVEHSPPPSHSRGQLPLGVKLWISKEF